MKIRLEIWQSAERSLKGGLAPGESLTMIGKLLATLRFR